MKKPISIILFSVAFVLIGCTTSPVTSDKAKPVPVERILAFKTNIHNGSTIVITRDSGFLAGGGCFMSILIDGKIAARIDTSETVSLYVEPGRHIVGISGDPLGGGLCHSKTSNPIKESSTEINTGEIQKFRILGDTNSGLDIRPSSV